MALFNILYKKNGNYGAIVYSTSYVSPLSELNLIEEELKFNDVVPGFVLFDLLLSNGQSFNRFIEGYFNGKKIEESSLNIASIPKESFVKDINRFYQENTKFLNDGILSTREKFLIAKRN